MEKQNNTTRRRSNKQKQRKKEISLGKGRKTKQSYAPISVSSENSTNFRLSQGSFPDSVRARGHELLDVVNVPNSAISGQTISNVYINPTVFEGSRLQRFSQIYEKFLFRKLTFRIVSAAPTTAIGSVLLAYDRDILDATPSASLAGVKQFMSWEGTRSAPIWQSFSIDCPLIAPDVGYFTNPSGDDDRLSYQGQLYLAVVNPTGSDVALQIHLHYDVEFFVPQLDSTSFQVAGANNTNYTPQANNGWSGINSAILPAKQLGVLANGSVGTLLPPGVYEIIQTLDKSATLNSWTLPFTLGKTNNNSQTQQTLQFKDNATSSYLRSKLNVTDPGGANIWGNTTGSGAINNASVIINRLSQVYSSII